MGLEMLAMELDVAVALLLACGSLLALRMWSGSSTKSNVPVLASDAFLGYRTASKTLKSFTQMMVDGQAKFKGKPFQLPLPRSWVVYVSRELFEDMRKARDDSLSFQEESVAIEYTLGNETANDPWHHSVVRKQMTQNLGAKFPEIYDEISQAFEDELKAADSGEWTPIHAYDVILHVVCRASNRLFVGLPLCRDEEFTKISRDFTVTVSRAGFLISCFPKFLKPLVARYISAAPSATKAFGRFIIPVIEQRQRAEAELGDAWKDQKPFDFLQWMLDAANEDQRDPRELNGRMLAMNFAATHTTSRTFTHALYWLAAHPKYIPELRQEVEGAIQTHGWSKDALNNMFKIDSFIKESMRLSGLIASSMQRKSVKKLTLSDGTQVPAGAHVAINAWSLHHDPQIYPNPFEFDPFRFSRKVKEGESVVKNTVTTASSEWLAWGGGIHVCPGRYFASQELKAMLAHIVINYDVKMPNEGIRPTDIWFGHHCIPNPNASVLFRKLVT
ncbi:cytochrome P450 [Calocera viscosa TUFC12733]|uniref:Cytochrome P450 n=1 Tax=Calocera viscosa (strain TUFC12733) TaxID=1330018 RepID=A0A167K9E2_CALVF|nr:cytochrome P450 [Calocera viscosa TUFC12733]